MLSGHAMRIRELLMSDNTIFHYTRTYVALEHILSEASLRFSRLHETEDPLEYKAPLIGMTFTGEPDDEAIYNSLTVAQSEMERIRQHRVGILCFTSNSPDCSDKSPNKPHAYVGCGFAKSRMWSQYGDGHRGICLAFDGEKIRNSLASASERPDWYDLSRVRYDLNQYENASSIFLEDVNPNEPRPYAERHVWDKRQGLFLAKDTDYRDEAEVRAIIWCPESGPVYLDITHSLVAIILGDRFPDGYLPLIQHHCDKFNVPCQKVHWRHARPFLNNCKFKV